MTNEFGLPSDLFTVAKFLRASKDIKLMEVVMADRRVDAFKGTQAAKALQSPAFGKLKAARQAADSEERDRIFQELLDAGIFIRARPTNKERIMQPDTSRQWSEEAVYVWVYQGSQLMTILGAIAFLAVAFFLASYQMWPSSLRRVTWYVMMLAFVFMGFLLVTSIIRLIVFMITYFTHKPGVWLFPNLFEDVGFFDSFIPLWDWHGAPTGPQAKKASKPLKKD